MRVNVNDLTITTLDTITGFDVSTGSWLFTLDELQSATIANSEEKVDITGKGGRKLGSIKRNKAVTISGSNGLISGGMLATQVGGDFESKEATPVKWTDYLVINSDTANTNYKAVGTAGNEIETVYIKNDDGTIKETLTQNAEASEGKFKYDPTTKKLDFEAGKYPDGTAIVVYYIRNIPGSVLSNISDNFSGKATLYIDATGEDKCNNTYRIQFFIPKADFNGTFDIALGENQAVHNFEADSLVASGFCGGAASGTNGLLWTYTVFGVNAEDVVTP